MCRPLLDHQRQAVAEAARRPPPERAPTHTCAPSTRAWRSGRLWEKTRLLVAAVGVGAGCELSAAAAGDQVAGMVSSASRAAKLGTSPRTASRSGPVVVRVRVLAVEIAVVGAAAAVGRAASNATVAM